MGVVREANEARGAVHISVLVKELRAFNGLAIALWRSLGYWMEELKRM